MKRRSSLKLLLAASAAASLAAGGWSSTTLAADPGKPLKVGAAVYGLKAEFMQIWTKSLKEHPAVKNKEVEITVFDGRYDASVQNNQFETMAAQKFDAIIFVPIDKEAGAAGVEKAVAANIPVVVSNARVNSKQIKSYIGSDDVIGGELEAEAVLSKMGYKGNVVIIEGPIGQSAQIDRRQGNMNVLNKHKDTVKILEMKTANWSRSEALTLMENWLTAHPGQINGIIGQNDEMALGAIQALKGAGMDPSKMPIAGIDGVKDALTAVKNGEMTSVLQDANAQAQGALDIAIAAVKGSSYQPTSPIWKAYAGKMEWKDGAQAEYSVPWTPITKENVDAMLAANK